MANSLKDMSSEDVIATFSCQPKGLDHMIPLPDLPTFLVIGRENDQTSFSVGALDCLPAEILHEILEELDVRSLSRLSRASHKARALVYGLHPYRDLITHASGLLHSLELADIRHFHTTRKLHEALTSQECVSCGCFGAFLFLLTCERCCYKCLEYNKALWAISTYTASNCFVLSFDDIDTLPVSFSVPGSYRGGIRVISKDDGVFGLVGVKALKELAIKRHGSIEKLTEMLKAGTIETESENVFYQYKYLQEADLQHYKKDALLEVYEPRYMSNVNLFGMTSIRFPSLFSDGTVEEGLSCRGCEYTRQSWTDDRLDESVWADLKSLGHIEEDTPLLAMAYRAMTRAGFLEHVKFCHGLRHLHPAIQWSHEPSIKAGATF